MTKTLRALASSREPPSSLFFDNLNSFVETPEGVAKLRELILDLAVRGKLVEQDENDEPASELLERLKEVPPESNGRKRKQVSPEPIRPDELPYDLPSSWKWARFCETATIASNLVKPKSFQDFPHVAPNNIEKATGRLLPYQTVAEDSVKSGNHRFFSGQILYSKIRPNLSKAVLVDFEGLCSADMYPIDPHIDASYLLKYILSSTFLGMAVKTDTRVAMPKINQTELNRVLIPLPPLSEQRRIVSKVDGLMSLCDELESWGSERVRLRERASRSCLDSLVSSRSRRDLSSAWQRLSDHFEVLYDTPETLAQLRQSILQLAVQGKLVPQDPNDEPVAELLQKASIERRSIWEACELAKFTSSEKLPKDDGWKRKYNDHASLTENLPYEVPQHWRWISFREILAQFQYGPRFAKGEYVSEGMPTVRTTDMNFMGQVKLDDAPKVQIPATSEDHWCLWQDDLLVTRTGATIGKCALYDESWGKAIASAYLIRFRFTRNNVYPPYVLLYMMSPIGQGLLVAGSTEMAQPNVNATSISEFPIPLPPLAEQKRIVAKVDQLLSQCDKLSARLRERQCATHGLLTATIHQLLRREVSNGQV